MKRKEKDMRLPGWVGGMSVLLFAIGGFFLFCAFWLSPECAIGTLICFGVGVAAILCWRNQWAVMDNDYTFTYSNMFGKKVSYRFADICGLKIHEDSYTLLLVNGKVHIERCAILSERFQEALMLAISKNTAVPEE